MSKSKIEWTDRTWIVTGGCSKVTKACDNCYAIDQSHRSAGPGRKYEGVTRRGKNGTEWTGKLKRFGNALEDPYKWKEPCRVFVNSTSDLFHPRVPFHFIQRVFNTMLATPHTYQVLTKRPERMAEFIDRIVWAAPPNIHLGFSAHDQPSFDKAYQAARYIPCAVLFASLEPLLGPVSLQNKNQLNYSRLDWIIVGGESGPRARPCDIQWIRNVVNQCRDAGAPCFVKQLGKNPADVQWEGEETICHWDQAIELYIKKMGHPKGGDPAEWPEELRVQQFPEAK